MLGETMRAAILVNQHEPLVVDDVRLPDRLEWGQVLVTVRYSGVCGSQLGEIDGVKGPDPYLPHLLGHEGVGVVVETGPGVTRVESGDTVVMHWMRGDGIEGPTPVYEWQGNRLNAGHITTFNEYAIVAENRVTKITDSHPRDPLLCLWGCSLTTGFGLVFNEAKVKPGEKVAIVGLGGIGQAAAFGCKLVHAYVSGFDKNPKKTQHMRAFGFKETGIGLNDTPVYDVAIETTGNPACIEAAYSCIKSNGRLVLAGVPPESPLPSIHTLPLHYGKQIIGSVGGGENPSEAIPRYFNLLNTSHFHNVSAFTKWLSGLYQIDSINQAIDDMRSGRAVGRCIIDTEAS